MKFNTLQITAKLIIVIFLLIFIVGCEEEISEPKISVPLNVVLSVEVYVLDKEFKIHPQTNIEIAFHESVKLNSVVKKEEFYTRITCPKGWVIERRNFEIYDNEEIFIGVSADSINTGDYFYKSINYDQLVGRADSSNSVLLFFPFTVYR